MKFVLGDLFFECVCGIGMFLSYSASVGLQERQERVLVLLC